MIAAGAVVSKDVDAGSIVAGVPARFHGWVNVAGEVVSRNGEIPLETQYMLGDPVASIKAYLKSLEMKRNIQRLI